MLSFAQVFTFLPLQNLRIVIMHGADEFLSVRQCQAKYDTLIPRIESASMCEISARGDPLVEAYLADLVTAVRLAVERIARENMVVFVRERIESRLNLYRRYRRHFRITWSHVISISWFSISHVAPRLLVPACAVKFAY